MKESKVAVHALCFFRYFLSCKRNRFSTRRPTARGKLSLCLRDFLPVQYPVATIMWFIKTDARISLVTTRYYQLYLMYTFLLLRTVSTFQHSSLQHNCQDSRLQCMVITASLVVSPTSSILATWYRSKFRIPPTPALPERRIKVDNQSFN